MRFGALVAADILRRHTVVLQKTANHIAYMVSAGFRHHSARHSRSPERDDTVECGAARNGLLRLVVLEQDVQYGFSDADNAMNSWFHVCPYCANCVQSYKKKMKNKNRYAKICTIRIFFLTLRQL